MKTHEKIMTWIEKTQKIDTLKAMLIEIIDNNTIDLEEVYRDHKNDINIYAKPKQVKL